MEMNSGVHKEVQRTHRTLQRPVAVTPRRPEGSGQPRKELWKERKRHGAEFVKGYLTVTYNSWSGGESGLLATRTAPIIRRLRAEPTFRKPLKPTTLRFAALTRKQADGSILRT